MNPKPHGLTPFSGLYNGDMRVILTYAKSNGYKVTVSYEGYEREIGDVFELNDTNYKEWIVYGSIKRLIIK